MSDLFIMFAIFLVPVSWDEQNERTRLMHARGTNIFLEKKHADIFVINVSKAKPSTAWWTWIKSKIFRQGHNFHRCWATIGANIQYSGIYCTKSTQHIHTPTFASTAHKLSRLAIPHIIPKTLYLSCYTAFFPVGWLVVYFCWRHLDRWNEANVIQKFLDVADERQRLSRPTKTTPLRFSRSECVHTRAPGIGCRFSGANPVIFQSHLTFLVTWPPYLSIQMSK